jgi:hypothetical protein
VLRKRVQLGFGPVVTRLLGEVAGELCACGLTCQHFPLTGLAAALWLRDTQLLGAWGGWGISLGSKWG